LVKVLRHLISKVTRFRQLGLGQVLDWLDDLGQRFGAEVASRHLPFVVLLGQHRTSTAPTNRMTAASFGKMPITSVRRFTFLFSRSSGLLLHTCRHARVGRP
jgi:hypothetical protein